MMIIDIRKLNAQKKYSGEMEFDYVAPENLIDIPFVRFSTPVKVAFAYDLYEDDSLDIRGKVRFSLEGQCSRCLQAAACDVEGELEAYFQPMKDAEDYSYSNGKVDLTKAVEDAVMACMPFNLSCGDSCVGLTYEDKTTNEKEN